MFLTTFNFTTKPNKQTNALKGIIFISGTRRTRKSELSLIMLSEICVASHTEKVEKHIISLICGM